MLKKIKNTDLFTMAILVILTGIVIYGLVMQVESLTGISPSTKTRTKIDTVIPSDAVYYDISPEWTENLDYIDAVMPAFAENTGVLPYLKVLAFDEITDPEELSSYAEKLYQELFSDEDHFLFVYAPKSGAKALSASVTGEHAGAVMDEEASSIFHQYLDKYSSNPECSRPELFLRVYRDTYERIMGITTDTLGIVYTVVLSALVLVLIYLMVRRVLKICRYSA